MESSNAKVIWLFGLPSSGKTTLASSLRDSLRAEGRMVCLLDGDTLRAGVNNDLGFSDDQRAENLRRSAHIALLLAEQQITVIAAFVTPKEIHRELVQSIIGPDKLRLVHVNCPLDVCVARDVKGLYARALSNRMSSMTGVQDTFEPPAAADLTLPTHEMTVADAVAQLLVAARGWMIE